MAATKRTKVEREAALAEVAALDRRGWTERQIAAKLGVSQSQITYDKKLLRKRYGAVQQEERRVYLEEKIAQYREIIAECWAAYDGSKTITRIIDKEEVVLPVNPDPRFVQVIMDCLKAERELRGLDAEKGSTTINNNNVQAIDWSAMMEPSTPAELESDIDRKLREVEQPKQLPCGLKEISPNTTNTNGTQPHRPNQ